jgi:hypothetical protein
MWWMAWTALAVTNGTIPVQGSLTDAGGAPLTGPQDVTLRLHTAATLGAVAHTEPLTLWFEDGAFSADLSLDLEQLAAQQAWWLSVEYGGVVSDRVPVGWAPRATWAIKAGDADKLGGVAASAWRKLTDSVSWSLLTGVPADLADGDQGVVFTPAADLSLSGGNLSVNDNQLSIGWSQLTGVPADLADGDQGTVFTPNADLTLSGGVLGVTDSALAIAWSQLTGVPTGLADGDNDTTYSAGAGITQSGTSFAVKPWALFDQDSFMGGAQGWTGSAIDQCAGTWILNGAMTANTTVEKTFTGLPAHTQVRVVAGYDFIDSWDSETGQAFIDGTMVWQQMRTTCCTLANVCGSTGYPDALNVPVEVEVAHTASTLTLRFTASIDSPGVDESFGINDVRLYTR